MNHQDVQRMEKPCASIFESEICLAAGNALAWGAERLETGADLLGGLSNAGTSIIQLAVPPAACAVHQSAHYAQSVQHFRKLIALAYEQLRLEYEGDIHSHHFLGLAHPSSGDAHSMHSLRRRNNLGQVVQFILTIEQSRNATEDRKATRDRLSESSEGSRNPTRRPSRLSPQAQCSHIRVRAHAFIYTHETDPTYEECRIDVISGKSPFRLAVEQNPDPRFRCFDFSTAPLSLSQIVLGSGEADAVCATASKSFVIPRSIEGQLAKLPVHVQETAKLVPVEDNLLLSLGVPGDCQLWIAYSPSPPHETQHAYLQEPSRDSLLEISDTVFPLGSGTPLASIYRCTLMVLRQRTRVGAVACAGASDNCTTQADAERGDACTKEHSAPAGDEPRDGDTVPVSTHKTRGMEHQEEPSSAEPTSALNMGLETVPEPKRDI